MFFVFAFLFIQNLNSQSLPRIIGPQIENLKLLHPEASILNKESKLSFEFKLNRSNYLIEVDVSHSDHFISLKENTTAFGIRLYDDSSKITDTDFEKSSRDVSMTKRCGDYEIDGIFFHDNKECQYRMLFPIEGDNSKLSTLTKHYDSRYLTSVYFPNIYFIANKTIEFIIPSNLDIELMEFNFEGYDIKKEIIEKEDNVTIIRYSAVNLDATNMNDIAGPSWIFPHILILSKAYTEKGIYYNLFNNNSDLYKWLGSLLEKESDDNKIDEIIKSFNYENLSDLQKIDTSLKWIQKNIRYIAYEDGIAGFKPESTKMLLTNKYGDCKGMANLCYFMLKKMGLDARRCWIGTNRIAYKEKYPSLSSDNHMICAVKTDSGFLYLDATDKYSYLDEVGSHIQNCLVAIESGDTAIIDTIHAKQKIHNTIIGKADMKLENEDYIITKSVVYTGENRKLILSIMESITGADRIEFLEYIMGASNNKIEIDSIFYGLDNEKKEFKIESEQRASKFIFNQIGKTFIPMDIEFGSKLMKIDANRKEHYNLGFSDYKEYSGTLLLKEGTIIDYLPDNKTYNSEGFSFSFCWERIENKIIYTKKLEIKNRIIKPDQFEEWNSFVEEYNTIADELIILK